MDAEDKLLHERGTSAWLTAARFGKSLQAVHYVLKGKAAVYQFAKKRGS